MSSECVVADCKQLRCTCGVYCVVACCFRRMSLTMLRSIVQQPGFRLELLHHKLFPTLASWDRLRNAATRPACSAPEASGDKASEATGKGENQSPVEEDTEASHEEASPGVDVSQLNVRFHASWVSAHLLSTQSHAHRYGCTLFQLGRLSYITQAAVACAFGKDSSRCPLSIHVWQLFRLFFGHLAPVMQTAYRLDIRALYPAV